MPDVIVTIDHVRRAGMCTRGARAWAAQHGIDYVDFLRNGIAASVLESKDGLGERVAAFARQEAAQRGQQ